MIFVIQAFYKLEYYTFLMYTLYLFSYNAGNIWEHEMMDSTRNLTLDITVFFVFVFAF